MVVNAYAILVSGAAGAVVTAAWYILFKDIHAKLLPKDSRQIVDFKTAPASSKVLDFLRGYIVAGVLAYLVGATHATTLGGAAGLAVVLWIGFPVVLLMAPVIWGRESWKLSVFHAGDWLLKLLVMTIIIGVWH
jgi:hypothetical protein